MVSQKQATKPGYASTWVIDFKLIEITDVRQNIKIVIKSPKKIIFRCEKLYDPFHPIYIVP